MKCYMEISIFYYDKKIFTLYLILWVYISYVYEVLYIKIILGFISILNVILRESVWNFSF